MGKMGFDLNNNKQKMLPFYSFLAFKLTNEQALSQVQPLKMSNKK